MRRRAHRPGGRAGGLRHSDSRPTRASVDAMPPGGEAPPETAICDFCTLAPASWSYPCRTFQVQYSDAVKTVFTSVGDWGACDACKELIEADEPPKLFARVMVGNVVKGICPPTGPIYELRCNDVLRTLKLFWQNRLGPVEVYE